MTTIKVKPVPRYASGSIVNISCSQCRESYPAKQYVVKSIIYDAIDYVGYKLLGDGQELPFDFSYKCIELIHEPELEVMQPDPFFVKHE